MKKLRCVFSVFMVMMIVIVMAVGCGSEANEKETKPEETVADEEKKSDRVEKMIEEIMQEGEEESDGVKGMFDELTEEDIQDLKDTIRDTVISDYLTPNSISPESFQWPAEEWVWSYFGLLTNAELTKFTPEDDDIDIAESITIPSDQMYLKDLMDVAFRGVLNWLDTQGEYDAEYYYNNVVRGVMMPWEEFFNTIEF